MDEYEKAIQTIERGLEEVDEAAEVIIADYIRHNRAMDPALRLALDTRRNVREYRAAKERG